MAIHGRDKCAATTTGKSSTGTVCPSSFSLSGMASHMWQAQRHAHGEPNHGPDLGDKLPLRQQPQMKRRSFHHLTCLAFAACALSSCVVTQKVPFNEADFQRSHGAGSGVVTGHAYIEMKDKSINVGSQSEVILYPVNPYTTEIITREYVHGENLAPPDSRISRYISTTSADDNGNFVFTGVAPGDYYVASRVHWVNHYWYPDNDGNLQDSADNHAQFIYSQIHVSNGQTIRVTDWNQNADWNLETVLH